MSEFFEGIKAGLEDALAYAEGDRSGRIVHEIVLSENNASAIRAKTGLSQSEFAQSIGVSVGTLRNWEQGRREPQGPARVLLSLIDAKPSIVSDMLATSD